MKIGFQSKIFKVSWYQVTKFQQGFGKLAPRAVLERADKKVKNDIK